MDPKLIAAARSAFPKAGPAVVLGAPVYAGECHPEPLVTLPLVMANRHGLIAGATGTGKTKSLQLMAEQLSAAGVSVFLADLKGDLSGIAVPGAADERITARAKETGYPWRPGSCAVELFSLTGARGAQVRATVSSFGPLLLAKVLDLNDTQTSVLSLLFKYCDDRGLELYDFADLRAALTHLSTEGAADLASYGGMSKQTVGVLLREMVELEAQGALAFFGEPELELDDLLRRAPDGRGIVSVLELSDVQDKPALFSTFMMWLLAKLQSHLPEVGDLPQPKLVFFFDEAHLLFNEAPKALLEKIEQVVRLIRSKGVGVYFVTQNPLDIPDSVLGQLGNRVQHALRAFTPKDQKAVKAAAQTMRANPTLDIESAITELSVGEALVSFLDEKGRPSVVERAFVLPPASRIGPASDAERAAAIKASPLYGHYEKTIDRESAYEKLKDRTAARQQTAQEPGPAKAGEGGIMDALGGVLVGRTGPRGGHRDGLLEAMAKGAARTIGSQIGREVVRGVLGSILGGGKHR
jgi:DNA helicase HerA-like ATPase